MGKCCLIFGGGVPSLVGGMKGEGGGGTVRRAPMTAKARDFLFRQRATICSSIVVMDNLCCSLRHV